MFWISPVTESAANRFDVGVIFDYWELGAAETIVFSLIPNRGAHHSDRPKELTFEPIFSCFITEAVFYEVNPKNTPKIMSKNI